MIRAGAGRGCERRGAHWGLALLTSLAAMVCGSAIAASPALANEPPDCPDAPSHEVESGQALDLSGDCTDADGPSPISYQLVSSPQFGTLTITSGNSVTYRSFVGYAGPDSFTYSASDGAAQTVVTVSINVTGGTPGANQPPTCPSAKAYVEEGGHVDLFGNCADPENDPITYGLTSPSPTKGTLTPLSASSVRYTPTVAAPNSDSFGYTAKDPLHPPSTTVVGIDIVPAGTTTYPPVAPEATVSEPYVATVEVPGGAEAGVNVDRRTVTTAPPEGFFLLNQEFDITAPARAPDDPLRLTFTIDESVPVGDLTVFRDGQPVANPCEVPGIADDDPCVESIDDSGGDTVITVLSSHASVWNFGTAIRAFDFGGFQSPVRERPDANSAKAGSAVPIKFDLGADEGNDVFAAGYPKSQQVSCGSIGDVDGTDTIASPGESGLQHEEGSSFYQLNWKTEKSWSGTCRQLVLRFSDPAQTTARADFSFK